jgi:hypothetical protein
MGTVPAIVVEYTRGSVSAENAGIFPDASCGIRVFAFFTAGYVFEYVLSDRHAAADAGAAFAGILSYVSCLTLVDFSMKVEAEGMIGQVHMDSINQTMTFRKRHLFREYPKPRTELRSKETIKKMKSANL